MKKRRSHSKRRKGKIDFILCLFLVSADLQGYKVEKREDNGWQASTWLDVEHGHSKYYLNEPLHRNIGTRSHSDGERTECFQINGSVKCNVIRKWLESNKIRNKKIKIINGNGTLKQQVTILQWNLGAKFWMNKLDELEAVTQQYSPEVCVITEANLLKSTSADERKIPGYDMHLPELLPGQNIFRIVVLTKSGLNINVLNELSDPAIAAIWLRIGSRGRKPMIVGTIYREHQYIHQDNQTDSLSDVNQLKRWFLFIEKWKLAARRGDVTIVGDVNLDFLRWGAPSQRNEKMIDKTKTEIETIGFHQIVEGATRFWADQTESCVDHIWMNSLGRLAFYRNIKRTFSDHNLLLLAFWTKDKLVNKNEIVRRDRKNFDEKNYKTKLSMIDWTGFFESTNLDHINNMFEEKVSEVLNSVAPIKIIQRRKKFKNWVSDSVKNEMIARDKLREIARVSQSKDDWEKYKKSRNNCVKSLRESKNDFFNKMYSKMNDEKDSKKLYGITNELIGKQSGNSPQQFVINGKIIRKQQEIANTQMNYYVDKIGKILGKMTDTGRDPHRFLDRALSTWESKDTFPLFELKKISLLQTEKLIQKMSNSTALGHDNLDTIGIKMGRVELMKQIRHIINVSLSQGKFTQKWKIAKLSPRLKGSDIDRDSPSSYRPIAILPVISKLVERSAQLQIIDYFENTDQLNPNCHAYRKHLSTTTTLAQILDEIYQNTEDKLITSMMTLDLTAAFDTVSHKLLLEKLQRYRIGPGAINWIRDYLMSRTQYVVIGRTQSTMKPVSCGVPQGSVIGPLMYAIFTNEMMEAVINQDCTNNEHNERRRLFGNNCRECGVLTLYADDSTMITGSRTRVQNQETIERCLEMITEYIKDNKLVLNLPKTSLTEIMIAQKRVKTVGEPPTLLVQNDDGEYKQVDDHNYTRILGANIQNNMLWNSHMESGKKALLPQCRKLLGRLKHNSRLIPRECRKNLVTGLLLSKLQYLMPLWGSASKQNLRKAQTILNVAARWITGLRKRTRIQTLMTAVNWLTIYEQIEMSTAILTWKLVYLEKPPRLLERMTVLQDKTIRVQEPRLHFTKDCLRWRAATKWNQLSEELREETSIKIFKKQMRKTLIERRPPEIPDTDW